MNEKNPLREVAQHLASKGRYGDTMMVHMNPIEVDMLSSLSPTGQLTTNPDTGQKEAFLPLLFSMVAPSLLAGSGMSALAASALGSGLGTIAEGGSLKEGITAGLMGGVTGGLMNKFASGSELFKDVGKTAGEALPEAADALSNIPANIPAPTDPNILRNMWEQGPHMPSGVPTADPSFLQRMGSGVTNALSPENIGQTAGSLGAGLVGEAYVPWDTPDAIAEEESEYQYEGPYMPTEQRSMIPMGDPLASAFEGEQMLLEGDVFPQGYNMRPDGYNYGGLIKRLNKGGMADMQGQIEAMAAEQRMKGDLMNQLATLPPNLSPEAQRLVNAEVPEAIFEERKRFRDYQPEGMLKGTMFDYVPDPVQTTRFLQDRLMGDRPVAPMPPTRTGDRPESMGSMAPFMHETFAGRRPREIDSRSHYIPPVDTVDDRGPDFRFTEEELRMPRRNGEYELPPVEVTGGRPAPRRKLMEPVR